ncbi:PBP1A family penicillin-binding protein [Hyphomicrobium methylovorum]|uniref:transglycosylase domain-containing protein n=1 Tax=Hyphomicrobium methylovorum TaxID=84 RepID=UPI0031B5FC14
MRVLRLLFLTIRLIVRLPFLILGRALGFGRPQRRAQPSPTLPGSFQSVADRAFQADRPAQPSGSPRKRGGRRWRFRNLNAKYRVALGAGVLAGGGVILTFAGMLVYYTVVFPDPLAVRNHERSPLVRILARDGSILAERGTAHDYLQLENIPKIVPAAVVATEDRRFFDHYGVDPAGFFRAVFANLRAGRFAQGGSTLTQQLAKNLFLTQERTLTRKLAELGLALWLEVRLSKSDILELYLNQVYLGGGAYGVGAASQRYFGKPVGDLTLGEAAIIAGLLKAPTKYSPANNPGAARARGRVVLSKMRDAGFISEDQEQRALSEPITFRDPQITKTAADAGYVIDYILEQLPPLASVENGDLIVETTLDKTLQQKAQEIVKDVLARKGETFGASQAALVVLDGEGGIRALVGGRDYGDSQFDRAVKARRQPGSAFKPVVYLAAIEAGMTPDSPVVDRPVTIGGWSPKNDNQQYAGAITLRQALAQSINTVAVRLNQDVGQGKTIEMARRLGIRSELHEGPSLPLGTSEVSLLEMTGAYTVFSNGGEAIDPHVVSRVRLSSGRVIYVSPPARTDRVVGETEIGALNDMLNAAVVYGTGRRAALPDHPAAGKTGTTQDFRDAWFVGFTSKLTAGVWVGNDNGKSMNRATGGSLPAEIWNRVMRVAHNGMRPAPLPGTTYSRADATFPDVSWIMPVGDAAPAHAPRVVQAREILPWSAEAQMRSRMRERDTADASRQERPHPASNIGEDFIRRVLSGGSSSQTPENVAADDEGSRRPNGGLFANWW